MAAIFFRYIDCTIHSEARSVSQALRFTSSLCKTPHSVTPLNFKLHHLNLCSTNLPYSDWGSDAIKGWHQLVKTGA
jgi:hypothetical protein